LDSSSITELIHEHHAIEAGLDRLSESMHSGNLAAEAVRDLVESIARHYANEETFLTILEACDRKLAAKLRAQHEETAEIGAQLLESLETRNAADSLSLSRRFVAIAQHNMIEEERDIFPLAERIRGPE
jgi:hypothetical protein